MQRQQNRHATPSYCVPFSIDTDALCTCYAGLHSASVFLGTDNRKCCLACARDVALLGAVHAAVRAVEVCAAAAEFLHLESPARFIAVMDELGTTVACAMLRAGPDPGLAQVCTDAVVFLTDIVARAVDGAAAALYWVKTALVYLQTPPLDIEFSSGTDAAHSMASFVGILVECASNEAFAAQVASSCLRDVMLLCELTLGRAEQGGDDNSCASAAAQQSLFLLLKLLQVSVADADLLGVASEALCQQSDETSFVQKIADRAMSLDSTDGRVVNFLAVLQVCSSTASFSPAVSAGAAALLQWLPPLLLDGNADIVVTAADLLLHLASSAASTSDASPAGGLLQRWVQGVGGYVCELLRDPKTDVAARRGLALLDEQIRACPPGATCDNDTVSFALVERVLHLTTTFPVVFDEFASGGGLWRLLSLSTERKGLAPCDAETLVGRVLEDGRDMSSPAFILCLSALHGVGCPPSASSALGNMLLHHLDQLGVDVMRASTFAHLFRGLALLSENSALNVARVDVIAAFGRIQSLHETAETAMLFCDCVRSVVKRGIATASALTAAGALSASFRVLHLHGETPAVRDALCALLGLEGCDAPLPQRDACARGDLHGLLAHLSREIVAAGIGVAPEVAVFSAVCFVGAGAGVLGADAMDSVRYVFLHDHGAFPSFRVVYELLHAAHAVLGWIPPLLASQVRVCGRLHGASHVDWDASKDLALAVCDFTWSAGFVAEVIFNSRKSWGGTSAGTAEVADVVAQGAAPQETISLLFGCNSAWRDASLLSLLSGISERACLAGAVLPALAQRALVRPREATVLDFLPQCLARCPGVHQHDMPLAQYAARHWSTSTRALEAMAHLVDRERGAQVGAFVVESGLLGVATADSSGSCRLAVCKLLLSCALFDRRCFETVSVEFVVNAIDEHKPALVATLSVVLSQPRHRVILRLMSPGSRLDLLRAAADLYFSDPASFAVDVAGLVSGLVASDRALAGDAALLAVVLHAHSTSLQAAGWQLASWRLLHATLSASPPWLGALRLSPLLQKALCSASAPESFAEWSLIQEVASLARGHAAMADLSSTALARLQDMPQPCQRDGDCGAPALGLRLIALGDREDDPVTVLLQET